MNQRQLKSLITAGVFSAAMLAGRAFADDQTTAGGSTPPTPEKPKANHVKTMKGHFCKGHNSCKGKGGCNTGDQGCKGKNSCKGKGGCATGDYKAKAAAPAKEAPSKAEEKASDNHGCSGKNGCAGK